MKFINGTKLDDRVLRTDWDAGFEEGRQFGRGRNGGQVRDEYRQDYDPDRGGFGHLLARGITLPCENQPEFSYYIVCLTLFANAQLRARSTVATDWAAKRRRTDNELLTICIFEDDSLHSHVCGGRSVLHAHLAHP